MIAASDLMVLAPELFLGLAIMILLLVGTALDVEREGPVLHAMTLGTLAITAVACLYAGDAEGRFFDGMIVADSLRRLLNFLVLGAAAGTVLISGAYTRARGIDRSEYYLLILLATLGMLLINAAGDLVMIFIGIETMSLAVYVLAGFRRNDSRGLEAAMKYFLFGAFATGFLLYGMALIYGATGSTNLAEIYERVQLLTPVTDQPVLMAGIAMLVAGLGFKVAAVPFHAWTPDVYEGAPTSVTAFMAVGVKVAAFAAVLRVFNEALGPAHPLWRDLLYALAVLSMIVGNVAAVVQSNVKRMLAYSSIAHAGYILVGVVVSPDLATAPAILFYLVVYGLMTLGAFGAIVALSRRGDELLAIDEYAGLSGRAPVLAFVLALCMFSLAGIPPTGGFVGKFYLFGQAIERGYYALAIVGVLSSVVSVYYYLRLPVVMYMREATGEAPAVTGGGGVGAMLALTVVGLLALGVVPAYLLDIARTTLAALP